MVTVLGTCFDPSIHPYRAYQKRPAQDPKLAAPDITIPNISITSPAGGSTLPRGDILVQGMAFDNPGGSGVRDVRVRV